MAINLSRRGSGGQLRREMYRAALNLQRCAPWLTKDNWPRTIPPRNNGMVQLLMQRPSLSVFVFLQVLDVLTTLIGLHLGAGEASLFISQLMRIGPVPALMVSKILAVILVMIAMRRYPRIVVMANFWFAAVVTWNLALICAQGWRNIPS